MNVAQVTARGGGPRSAFSFLVGDVGGTNCRFALAKPSPEGGLALRHLQHFKCADFSGAEDAIDAYLRSLPERPPLGAVVLAVAGPVIDGDVKSTNMAWRLSERALRPHAASVKLINDFTALSMSVGRLPATDLRRIGPDVAGAASETVALLGAGTGLGAGALARGIGGAVAIATEGGHMSYAPVDDSEFEILRLLRQRFGRVSVERVLSGPGLENLRWALAQIGGYRYETLSSEGIVTAALAGDPLSRETLIRFCLIYGSVAGDVALMFGARGGLYLGGGIAPAIGELLDNGGFRSRFESKGRFRDYLAAIPTWIITNTDAALVGAAHLAAAMSLGA